MEETIKGIEVIAYKGMNSDMTCRDFKYEIGKTYKTNKVKLCECGFHACLNPRDVLKYYSEKSSRYFKVKLFGEITKCVKSDTKVTATEIIILEEITGTFNEVIKTTEWWKNENILDLLYFSDGFARVQRSDYLCNFINKQGKYLSKEWFYWVGDFYDGFAVVQRGDKLYNFIDKDGKYLIDEWFNRVFDFNDGLARVKKANGEWNFVDKQGNYLFNEWFYLLDTFHEGFARVKRGDKLYNFINKQGKFLSNKWFIDAYSFVNGFAKVKRTNDEYAKIDKSGNLIKILQ